MTPQMVEKWMSVCLTCTHVMNGKLYACEKCDSDKVHQKDIGYLFPKNLERLGMADNLPEVRPEEVELLEEPPEMRRKRENEK